MTARTEKPQVEGFGAPVEDLRHHFRVEIPAAATAPVIVVEVFGLSGYEGGVPQEEARVSVPRQTWTKISEAARRDFNARLKAVKLPAGRWQVGTVKVERLLGKELCVVAWAAETAPKEALPIIVRKWASLRPEERWWLFSMTVAEAGRLDDGTRGWRKALFHALSDPGPDTVDSPRRRPAKEERSMLLPMFSE
jgi:hypothetical protein